MATRSDIRAQSLKIAFCGMAVGLSAVFMLLGGVIPIATYAVPMACGLLLLPILIEFGQSAAWTTFAAAALLSLLLDPDKEAALFYLFIGWYPIVKWRLDRIPARPRRLLARLALFTGAICVMYGLMSLLFPMGDMTQEFREMGALLTVVFGLVYNVSMLLYDRLLVRAMMLYAVRLRPRLRFLR